MTVFTLQIMTKTTGSNSRIIADDIYGVYSTKDNAIKAIYEFANGEKIDIEANIYEWFFVGEDEELVYARACIREFTIDE